MRAHILQATGLQNGNARLLEVGCGTGAILQSLQQVTTPGKLWGVDMDFTALLEAQTHAPTALLAAAEASHLPFASRSLHGVVCHFLLVWLEDPARALREMCRVVKSGGWVIAFAEPDYAARIDYPDSLQRLAAMQTAALQCQGAHCATGRSLRGLFHQIGLNNVQSGLISGHWQTAFDAEDWAQEWEVLKVDLKDQLSEEELEDLRQIDLSVWQSGERILYIPTFYAWGQVL